MSMRQFVHRCWRLGSYVQFDSLIEIWLICRDSYVWHDSCRFTRVTDIYKCTYIHMYIYMWCTYIYIYIYTHTHRYIHIHYVYILFIYIYIYKYIYIYIYIWYTYIFIYKQICIINTYEYHIFQRLDRARQLLASFVRHIYICVYVRTRTYVHSRMAEEARSCKTVAGVFRKCDIWYTYIYTFTHMDKPV